VKTFLWLGACLALGVVGCSSASTSESTTAGTGGATGTSGTTSGGVVTAKIGTVCQPTSAVDGCAAAGLVCDAVTQTCRLPNMGEECALNVGCNDGAWPPGLTCQSVNVNGTAVSLCLLACTGTDSAPCPYGTTCQSGDCLPYPAGTCVAGQTCMLGESAIGQCLQDGVQTICVAVGDQQNPYGPCEPQALNSEASKLCGPGLICRATPEILGGFADAGYCYPLCGDGCPSDEHCSQPEGAFYEVCRPGISCEIDLDTCPAPEAVCVPDDPSSLAGGCLPIFGDAGAGAACEPPAGVPQWSPCQVGACVENDGGTACTPLCDRASGGRPYCVGGTCEPLTAGSSSTDVVGACR